MMGTLISMLYVLVHLMLMAAVGYRSLDSSLLIQENRGERFNVLSRSNPSNLATTFRFLTPELWVIYACCMPFEDVEAQVSHLSEAPW